MESFKLPESFLACFDFTGAFFAFAGCADELDTFEYFTGAAPLPSSKPIWRN
ncbi:MAG: hypothetical protein GDA42_13035 [Ekhidna sp.]|nr:hypothetical protein [Ekhidna sp.]